MEIRDHAEYILASARASGATQAECAVTATRRTELNADVGGFTLMRTTFGHSLSLKIIRDGRKGSAATNSLEKEDIDAMIRDAAAAAEASQPDLAEDVAELCENGSFSSGSEEPDRDVLYTRSAEFLEDLATRWPKISLDSFTAVHIHSHRLYRNTRGVDLSSSAGVYAFSAMFYAKDGEKTSSFASTDFVTATANRRLIECGDFAELLDQCVAQLEPVVFSGKAICPVIATPACAESLLCDALANFASDVPLIDGTSVWKDKLGEAVASPLLTLRCDPEDPRLAAGTRVTHDGYRTAPMDIIREGRLESFLLSRYGAARTGLARASVYGEDLIAEPGDTSLAEMIAGVEDGLLLCRVSGGEPAPNGDFSAVAKNSFRIRHGRIAEAVSETMVSGNLAEMLKNITAISRETLENGDSVMPWIRFDGLTVSGK
ncbi:MAG: TldD/PmbA family protein [Clostridia bacterium]|nr:TldD/PmbA family protein [Clostridia bacterium]